MTRNSTPRNEVPKKIGRYLMLGRTKGHRKFMKAESFYGLIFGGFLLYFLGISQSKPKNLSLPSVGTPVCGFQPMAS